MLPCAQGKCPSEQLDMRICPPCLCLQVRRPRLFFSATEALVRGTACGRSFCLLHKVKAEIFRDPHIASLPLFSANDDEVLTWMLGSPRSRRSVLQVRPLRRQLKTLKAWITGQRKDQSPGTRAAVPVAEVDPVFEGLDGGPGSLVKFNPLSDVTSQEVWNFLRVMVRTSPTGAKSLRMEGLWAIDVLVQGVLSVLPDCGLLGGQARRLVTCHAACRTCQ